MKSMIAITVVAIGLAVFLLADLPIPFVKGAESSAPTTKVQPVAVAQPIQPEDEIKEELRVAQKKILVMLEVQNELLQQLVEKSTPPEYPAVAPKPMPTTPAVAPPKLLPPVQPIDTHFGPKSQQTILRRIPKIYPTNEYYIVGFNDDDDD